MKNRILAIINWLIVLWICKIFVGSLPYKFSNHPDTQHIFGTIGTWMSDTLNEGLGSVFTQYGAYVVGSVELTVSIILLIPAVLWLLSKTPLIKTLPSPAPFHATGGLIASGVMVGAAFFHLFTPLGIEVLHQGKSDNGSLFYAAVSIIVLGFYLFASNAWQIMQQRK